MANINFYLKSGQANKKGERSIVMRITFENNRTIIFTNCRVHPKFWNSNKQQVRPPNQREPENHHIFINDTLQTFRRKAEDAISNALRNDLEMSEAYFKNWFSKKKEKKNDKSFFAWFEEYIETGKSDKAKRTIMGYTTVKNFLEDFEEDTKSYIDMHNIDMNFFDELKKYAFSDRKVQDNYFAKIINVLKSFLNWVKDRGGIKDDTYSRFKAPEREKEIIFLTIDELMHLYKYDFKNKRLEKARDIYCFGCFTGLRISDILELQHEHIKDGNINKTIRKTGVKETIPLNEFAAEILEKYKGLNEKALPSISSQNLNVYIKECCRKAKINGPVTITRFSGSKREELSLPKCELITTHTARKTFLTNSIILGMNVMAAKGISGHKRDRNFNKYVKIAEDFKKREMERTWGQLNK